MTTGEIGERQIDDRVDQPLAAELLADEHQGAEHAEDRVQRHRDPDADDRHPEGVDARPSW